jgi:hypothetical protein
MAERSSFGENLEQQLGSAPVQLQITQLVDLCRNRHRLTYPDPATMPSLWRREPETSAPVC